MPKWPRCASRVAALIAACGASVGCRGAHNAADREDAAHEMADVGARDAEAANRASERDSAAGQRESDEAGWDDAEPPASPRTAADGGEALLRARRRCPRDMVDVAGQICVDRFEASLVDELTGRKLSPHYPPEPDVAVRIFEKWQEARLTVGPALARAMPLPPLPDLERTATFRPKAVSLKSVIPQGYISGKVASDACARAGKRLCTHEEWMLACRGEAQTKFPYGPDYRANVCNVFRSQHPAQKLHDDASAGHSDPRLGLVIAEDGPLLRATGATKTCASRWGDDAIYDMVGNEDEWIDDPNGTFVGGFFSRSTREGCESIVTVHPFTHWDYSIGLRCCAPPR